MAILTTREADVDSAAGFLWVTSAFVVVAANLEVAWRGVFGVRATGLPVVSGIVPGIVSGIS